MTLQSRLQAILTPCWHDALRYGPRAPKGFLLVDGHDLDALSILDDAGTFTVFVAEAISLSLIDAWDLSPLEEPASFSVEGNQVGYVITQDLSIKAITPPKD